MNGKKLWLEEIDPYKSILTRKGFNNGFVRKKYQKRFNASSKNEVDFTEYLVRIAELYHEKRWNRCLLEIGKKCVKDEFDLNKNFVLGEIPYTDSIVWIVYFYDQKRQREIGFDYWLKQKKATPFRIENDTPISCKKCEEAIF